MKIVRNLINNTMAIKFKVYSTPKPNSRKGSKLSHARAISQGTYNLEKVCKLISERSAVSSAEVKSVLGDRTGSGRWLSCGVG